MSKFKPSKEWWAGLFAGTLVGFLGNLAAELFFMAYYPQGLDKNIAHIAFMIMLIAIFICFYIIRPRASRAK